MAQSAQEVHDFWFVAHGPEDWFMGAEDFDRKVHEQLRDIHAQAERGELWQWRQTPDGRVAELILLDQISRQLYRGQARAFACDRMALALAQELIAQSLNEPMDVHHRLFVYMPFQHAESLVIQEESLRLFKALGNDEYLPYAIEHHAVIERFGRFPFRNAALGRTSTPEEIAYMKEREGKAY